jgi:hypothetical protein
MTENDMIAWYERLSAFDKRWIYRFRPYSALSLKELYHQEVYFSYSDELVDPLDLEVNLVIEQNEEYVHRFFLDGALESVPLIRGKYRHERDKFLSKVCRDLATRRCELRMIIAEFRQNYLKQVFVESGLPESYFSAFSRNWHAVLMNLYPKRLCSVSFTKECANTMMWANFAGGHRGFCLAFLPRRNRIALHKREGEDPKEYVLDKVSYKTDVDVHLSEMFDDAGEYSAECLAESYLKTLYRKALYTKNPRFKDEKEYRITNGVSVAFSHFTDPPPREASLERTYHYDKSQLKAILLGIRLNRAEKEEILCIVKEKLLKVRVFECLSVGNEMQFAIHSAHA